MLRPPPFPDSIATFTPELLSSALGHEVVAFDHHRIGADRGMLGDVFLVTPHYAEDTGGPAVVAVKFAANREGSLASARRGRTHERELRCYDELLSDTPVRTPLLHGCWYDPETARFILVQEAIDADDGIDQVEGIDVERARLVMVEAAKLHARWWQDPSLPDRDWLPRLDSEQRLQNLVHLATAGWSLMCDLLGDELSSDEQRLGERFPEMLEASLRHISDLPSTLVHSDLRADNLLFSPDGTEVAIVDWQGVGVGPPGFDLAYFLSQSLTVNDRRAHEADLIDTYRRTAEANGLTLDTAQILEGYGDAMRYGLVIACALPVISDSSEPRVRRLAAAVARRSIEGMRDHGRLWDV